MMVHFNTKHGLRESRIYSIWTDIKTRCNNKNCKSYKNYGARGITVYNEWLYDFLSFYNWSMDNGYSDKLSIDRIDNDKNYEPDNCRWTTKEIQARNTRKVRINNKSGYRGVCWYKPTHKWHSQITVDAYNINLGYFNNIIDAAKAYDDYVIKNNLEHTRNFS